MSANTPLITDASRLAATQNVDNYAEGVAVHINGDWARHYQLTFIDAPWVDANGDTISGSQRLRIPLTTETGALIYVVVPVVPFYPVGTGDAPSIMVQPQPVSIGTGGSARFSVEAYNATATPYTYQWLKNGVTISGATSNQFVVNNANVNDSGFYSCLVSNSFGQTLSNSAELVVIFTQQSWTAESSEFWFGWLIGIPPI